MKSILVPVDFSEHSEYALEVAANIAKRFEAKLILFHMIGVSASVLAKSEVEEREEVKYYLKLAREKLATFLDRPYLKNVAIETIIQNLKDFAEVAVVAQEQQADLIVMGSHGTSGLSTFFVGSNTEKVVRTSEIPTLVIKTKRPNFDINTIAFANDLQPENVLAYKKVEDFARFFNAELKLVYINTVGSDFKSNTQIEEYMKGFVTALGTEVPIVIYNDYSVELGIYNYAKSISADMVALPTHGRRGLAHFFLGSIGEKLANTAMLPVLTIKI